MHTASVYIFCCFFTGRKRERESFCGNGVGEEEGVSVSKVASLSKFSTDCKRHKNLEYIIRQRLVLVRNRVHLSVDWEGERMLWIDCSKNSDS